MAHHGSRKPIRKILTSGVVGTVLAILVPVISSAVGWDVSDIFAGLIAALGGAGAGYATPSAPGEPQPSQPHSAT